MPAIGNPLQSNSLRSDFALTGGPFMPKQMGQNHFIGAAAPQGAPKPLNSDIAQPKGLPGSGQNVHQPFQLNGLYNEIFAAQPDQVLPFVPAPTAGLIRDMLGMHNTYAGATLPLLDMLLGEMGSRSDLTQQYFGPEMALRQGILDQLARQDNSLLEQLLAAQQRASQPQTSGSFFFAGF